MLPLATLEMLAGWNKNDDRLYCGRETFFGGAPMGERGRCGAGLGLVRSGMVSGLASTSLAIAAEPRIGRALLEEAAPTTVLPILLLCRKSG